MPKIEVVFDKANGKFVVHYEGVSSHDAEHKLTEEMITKLKIAGFDVEVEHFHDEPNIPVVDKEEEAPRKQRNKVK